MQAVAAAERFQNSPLEVFDEVREIQDGTSAQILLGREMLPEVKMSNDQVKYIVEEARRGGVQVRGGAPASPVLCAVALSRLCPWPSLRARVCTTLRRIGPRSVCRHSDRMRVDGWRETRACVCVWVHAGGRALRLGTGRQLSCRFVW